MSATKKVLTKDIVDLLTGQGIAGGKIVELVPGPDGRLSQVAYSSWIQYSELKTDPATHWTTLLASHEPIPNTYLWLMVYRSETGLSQDGRPVRCQWWNITDEEVERNSAIPATDGIQNLPLIVWQWGVSEVKNAHIVVTNVLTDRIHSLEAEKSYLLDQVLQLAKMLYQYQLFLKSVEYGGSLNDGAAAEMFDQMKERAANWLENNSEMLLAGNDVLAAGVKELWPKTAPYADLVASGIKRVVKPPQSGTPAPDAKEA